MRDVDSLLHARWVIPVEPDNQVLENHTLVIDKGRILDLLLMEWLNHYIWPAEQRWGNEESVRDYG